MIWDYVGRWCDEFCHEKHGMVYRHFQGNMDFFVAWMKGVHNLLMETDTEVEIKLGHGEDNFTSKLEYHH